MGSGDFALTAHVRQVFARHWIETQGMHLVATNATLTIMGRIAFRSVKQGRSTINAEFLGMLEGEIRTIRGLKRVRWQLDNWTKREDGWVEAEGGDPKPQQGPGAPKGAPQGRGQQGQAPPG